MIVQSDLSFKRHVQAVSCSSFFQLRQLRNVRHSVDNETAATLIHAFVSSRLDYCNSLLSGTPKVVTDVLQTVQNAAARLLLGYSRCQSDLQKAMREKLHWLRITDQINYKLLCFTCYKALHGQAPEYLQELCIPASSDIHQ